MSREKQIEEMAKVIDGFLMGELGMRLTDDILVKLAEHPYNAGYRKQNDGKWVLVGNGNGGAIYWQCSVCGYETSDVINGDTNFCHNCGADMRGGAE